ncbi:unnamed protein product [Aphanomyces euteiches]|uniref:Uncharacterized protein n=1 Tax=Aphanomyces euteiches TaxID=100861 RepID=A0A6G0XVR6_9STRA|nr:hypothetical protein Ae201684_001235 [Aphanomyces euteiches]KAH9099634.1 hypothetical protein Ae201684P_018647 [Aphanomyces euteiches]KAH9147069.1 hypothetical protein LEN26_004802 [Aphanomyces euteiches]KAH9151699.1 hypothetical protein AeRB84_005735 [Aphanomyces euteiches]
MEVVLDDVKETVYKIIMIGSAGVGKTNLIGVGARGLSYNDKSAATLNPEFATVKIQRPDWKVGESHQYITAHIWDTAGQERYQAISTSHYRRVHGAILVYDVTSKNSFKEIYPGLSSGGLSWLRALKQNADPDILGGVMLVENKIDKVDKDQPRPPAYVQENEVTKLLMDVVYRDPVEGVGWLHNGKPDKVTPYRLANSMMFARASALTNECELFEMNERKAATVNEMFHKQSDLLGYEKTDGVSSVSKAIEALVLRIYERSKDMHAGGTKVKGKPFKLIKASPVAPTSADQCC